MNYGCVALGPVADYVGMNDGRPIIVPTDIMFCCITSAWSS